MSEFVDISDLVASNDLPSIDIDGYVAGITKTGPITITGRWDDVWASPRDFEVTLVKQHLPRKPKKVLKKLFAGVRLRAGERRRLRKIKLLVSVGHEVSYRRKV